MNKPVTKEDIARINAFSNYLVPISKFKEQLLIKKELNHTIDLIPERQSIVDNPSSADTLVRNALKDLVKTKRKQ